jgi:hypothetical protein
MLDQVRSVREQWAHHIVAALENRKSVNRLLQERHDASAKSICVETHAERRRFRSEAQLRAEREEDKREWVNSSPRPKREEED